MLLLRNLSFHNWLHYWPCVRWNHWSSVDSRRKGSLEWSVGGSVCGDSIAGGFPLQKVGLMFYFMFAWTSCLTNNRVASELKSYDVYAMSLLCVICQSDIPHGWTSGWLHRNYIESLTGSIIYKKHRFDLRDQQITGWRHQTETSSALLAICAGNSPVTGEFPAQRPVTRSFDVFFDLRPNKQLNKQSWGWLIWESIAPIMTSL